MSERLSHDIARRSSSTDVKGKYREKRDHVERRHGPTRDSIVSEEERLRRDDRDSVYESDDRTRGRKHRRRAAERLSERKQSRSASPKNKSEWSRSGSPSGSRHAANKRRRESVSRSRSPRSESSDSSRSHSHKTKRHKTDKDGGRERERKHKKHHKKDVDVRRSVLTGKKIKLKVHKDRADIERDSKREELLEFLNSAYD